MIFGFWGRTSYQPTGDGEPATSTLDQPIIHPFIQYPVPVAIETGFHPSQSSSDIQSSITINWFPVINHQQVIASPVAVQRWRGIPSSNTIKSPEKFKLKTKDISRDCDKPKGFGLVLVQCVSIDNKFIKCLNIINRLFTGTGINI